MIRILVLAGAVLAAGAWAASEPSRFTDKQLEARFSYDLGADSVDVSGYPKAQQENYKVFSEVCSRCHTLARPINSPLASRADWKRFIARMHARTKNMAGADFTKEQAKAVVDFLAYDSGIRKVREKKSFEAETARLKSLFAEVRAERARVNAESDARKAKPYGDQMPAQPRP